MSNKLFEQKPKSAQISTQRWVRILPDRGEGFHLYDVLEEKFIGRILADDDDNWIYDGQQLTVDEQEEIAGLITGNQKEMKKLISSLF